MRYDSTNQKEDGTTSYDYKNYYPIGEYITKDRSDMSSPDVKIQFSKDEYDKAKTNSNGYKVVGAYVENAESLIVNEHVNLYHSYNVKDTSELEGVFKNIYSHFVKGTMADKNTVEKSISEWLGEKYGKAFKDGKIEVLWYVIKTESDGHHVDGVLYWIDTGDVVDDNDDPDNHKAKEEPKTEHETEENNTKTDTTSAETNVNKSVAEQNNNTVSITPQTGDNDLARIMIALMLLALFVGTISVRLRKKKE